MHANFMLAGTLAFFAVDSPGLTGAPGSFGPAIFKYPRCPTSLKGCRRSKLMQAKPFNKRSKVLHMSRSKDYTEDLKKNQHLMLFMPSSSPPPPHVAANIVSAHRRAAALLVPTVPRRRQGHQNEADLLRVQDASDGTPLSRIRKTAGRYFGMEAWAGCQAFVQVHGPCAKRKSRHLLLVAMHLFLIASCYY